VQPVIDRCRGPVEQALPTSHITPKDIDRIVFRRRPDAHAGGAPTSF